MIEYRNLRVALLGCGSVGTQVARLMREHGEELAQRVGARLELVGIAVRDAEAPRDPAVPRELLTTDAESLILGADIVIELMGGIEPARAHILAAISSGADVVTANKALLATHGPELFEAAEQVGAQLYYEAAVAGAIPIIRPLRDSLAGDRVERILGIVNGTTNYILDEMDTHGLGFDEALATATELGYAEADPTADIEGFDAAQKAAILASLAFHTRVPVESVHREGITGLSSAQFDSARKAGYVIKLLAICERLTDPATGRDAVSARVYPALVPRDHPLAAVHGRRRPHVLRRGRRGSADRVRRPRRRRLRRAPPRRRRTGRRRVDARRPRDAARRRDHDPVPDHAAGGGRAGRARPHRAAVQRARRLRGDARADHAPGPPGGRGGRPAHR
jgi:homoserine dehydrogenase